MTTPARTKSLKLFQLYPDLEEIKCPYKPTSHEAQQFPFKSNLHRKLHDDNPYIFSGYRRMPVQNWTRSLWSALTLHNDTWNIWTHGLPALYWIYAMISTDYQLQSLIATTADRIAFAFLSFCCLACMVFSALYHTLRMDSENMYNVCLSCDLRGIVLVLIGANVMTANLMLRQFPFWQNIWLTIIIVAFIALAKWIPHMVLHRLSNQRTLYFTLYSFISAVILLQRHFILLPSLPTYSAADESATWEYLWIQVVTYGSSGIGLVIRNLKYPEKAFPYKFDYYLSSHQIFHTICVFGNLALLHGSLNWYKQRVGHL